MAVLMVSVVVEDCRVWIMASSLSFRVVCSSGEILSVVGSAGSEESMVMAEDEGDDSASNSAWRTAESLVVRAGFDGWIVVAIMICDSPVDDSSR